MAELSRKEREKAARRELILNAAEEIIQRRGFKSATMDEIAEKAEVAKGTLYLYFKNKTSIYIAICERGSSILNKRMAEVLTLDIKGLNMIEKLGYTYLKFIRENPHYFHAFSYYESIIDEEVIKNSEIAKQCEQNARNAMTYIVRSIQIGMQDGSINDSYDPKELGIIIWGASKGIVHMAFLKQTGHHPSILDDVEFSLESLVESFIQLVGVGIVKK
jgi:AcrR family transcriptional regulator